MNEEEEVGAPRDGADVAGEVAAEARGVVLRFVQGDLLAMLLLAMRAKKDDDRVLCMSSSTSISLEEDKEEEEEDVLGAMVLLHWLLMSMG